MPTKEYIQNYRKKRKQLEVKNEPVANPIKLLPVKFTRVQQIFYECSRIESYKSFL